MEKAEGKTASECSGEQISLYIDHMLDEGQAARLQRHFVTCAACRTDYEMLYAMMQALRHIPQQPVPESFDLRLRTALTAGMTDPDLPAAKQAGKKEDKQNSDRQKKTGRRRRMRVYASVAAVFCIGLISVLAYNDVTGDGESSYRTISEETGNSDVGVRQADLPSDWDSLREAQEAAQTEEEDAPSDETQDGRDNALSAGGGIAGAGGPQVGTSGGWSSPRSAAMLDLDLEAAAFNAFGSEESGQNEEQTEPPATGTPSRSFSDIPATAGAGSAQSTQPTREEQCDKLMEKKLDGFSYEVVSSEWKDEVRVYRVMIYQNPRGMTFDQEVEICVEGEAVRVLYASEFMGL